jgi:peroxiredoxin
VIDIQPLIPRQKVPALEVATVGTGPWRLSDQSPENFTMIVFYRGLHCPVCARQLQELRDRLPEFEQRGVKVIAISSDAEDRARQTKEKYKLDNLTIGYGLELDKAREWGLYLSSGRGKTSIGIEEPSLFTEPALYLVRPDQTLYFGSVQTMPFARPHFDDVLTAINYAVDKNYPARGEVVDWRSNASG